MAPALNISIPSASTATPSGSKPFTQYHIVLQLPLRKHEVRKRYTDFTTLQDALVSQPAKPQQPPPPALAPLAQPRYVQDATQAATAAVAAAMAKLGATNTSQQGAVDNLTQKVNQMRVQGGPHDQQNRGRGRGRGGPGQRGDRRESQPQAIEVPKEDYDFESANAKFNKEDLAKEGVASPSHNGDTKSVENGHAHDNEEDVTIPTDKSYNKKSSFFDDISSDLKDRTEAAQSGGHYVDGRAMRREERSRNMETFGQGSVDVGGYRGGFRGRGRGRGFGRGEGRGGGRGFGGRGGFEDRGPGVRGRGRGDFAPPV